jgi:Zn/Cd-binding protein ZinT
LYPFFLAAYPTCPVIVFGHLSNRHEFESQINIYGFCKENHKKTKKYVYAPKKILCLKQGNMIENMIIANSNTDEKPKTHLKYT